MRDYTTIAYIPTRLIPYLRTGTLGDTTREERTLADKYDSHFILVSPAFPAFPDSRFMEAPAFGGPAPATPWHVESRYRYTGHVLAPLTTRLHNCMIYFWGEKSEAPIGAHKPDGRRSIGVYLNTLTSVLFRNEQWTAFAIVRNRRVLLATHDVYIPTSIARIKNFSA